MPLRRFVPALCAGSMPMGFVYAWIGARGVENPVVALVVSAVLPPVIWLALRGVFRRRDDSHDPVARP
jgi:uncharacterized membrane protein YdjX (TVP38/TMEM64 family)